MTLTKEEIKKIKSDIRLAKVNMAHHKKQFEYYKEEMEIDEEYLKEMTSLNR